jgi:MFS family permease
MLDSGKVFLHYGGMISSPSSPPSPFALGNIRRFIAFRVFFNARFYYPVFTILFLDYGLTIEQFALLNTVWAATIVLAEVPSGALADMIGRKRLLVVTSMLMIMELAIIAFVPTGNTTLIFWAFLINRIISGLAEAMASGADEALAYDTLVQAGIADEWPRVLEMQMRIQHISYIFAMTIGALVYDADAVSKFLSWLGTDIVVQQQVTMRWPIFLTLTLGILALFTSRGMRDPVVADFRKNQQLWKQIKEAVNLSVAAGRWILRTPFALAIILVGMSYDHVLRMLATLSSQYFRQINLPEASFGLIGSGIAVVGLIVPRIAMIMSHRCSPAVNGVVVGIIAFTSVWSLTLFLPWVGILPVVFIFVAMTMTSFFTSHYLNKITDSFHRATVLSFKGLAFNAAYGIIGLFYAFLVADLRGTAGKKEPDWSSQMAAEEAFYNSIGWFPWYLLVVVIIVSFFLWFKSLKNDS